MRLQEPRFASLAVVQSVQYSGHYTYALHCHNSLTYSIWLCTNEIIVETHSPGVHETISNSKMCKQEVSCSRTTCHLDSKCTPYCTVHCRLPCNVAELSLTTSFLSLVCPCKYYTQTALVNVVGRNCRPMMLTDNNSAETYATL